MVQVWYTVISDSLIAKNEFPQYLQCIYPVADYKYIHGC